MPHPPAPLALGGTTYSWMHQATLTEALRGLAEAGFTQVELTTAAPHLQSGAAGTLERHALVRELRALGLTPTSVNPGFLDINLLSPSNEFRALSLRAMLDELELAADLGAPYVIAMPGRRHALSPAPDEACRWWLDQALDTLVTRGEALGVALALETNPYGYLGSAAQLTEIADRVDSPWLGIAYDAANTLTVENVADGVRTAAHRLKIAHVSDTWRDRWVHTSPGRGEVDFAAYADALREVGYTGPTIYELIDMEPPGPRLARDIATFGQYGWTTEAVGDLPAAPRRRPAAQGEGS
ncbi:sugar phosphate isomerase/epimerase family protein [Streptomyces hoynatensis]|uniref:Sugar phosphate isomerase/epimerase n=1 Tax=Streptomyces hoynatensis TaxID=1141874 RepID=A0A3A9Z6W6_9ACTN|nr:sugar phosphate isomerase/epimerase [Streptomyces hoynatensis]RKN44003.1 sugar phosphate isomerase/epimerase [Streptomyces hoynatensis]